MTHDLLPSGGAPVRLPRAAWALAWSCLAGQVLARDGLTGWPVLHLLASAAALVSLMRFSSTEYYRWQRSRPRVAGPSLVPMVLIAVLVGVLGASTAAAPDGGSGIRVRFGT